MGTDADKEENYSFSQTGPGHQLDLPSWHYTHEPGRFGFGDAEEKKSNLIFAYIEELVSENEISFSMLRKTGMSFSMCAGIFYVFYTIRREAVKELTASTAKAKELPWARK